MTPAAVILNLKATNNVRHRTLIICEASCSLHMWSIVSSLYLRRRIHIVCAYPTSSLWSGGRESEMMINLPSNYCPGIKVGSISDLLRRLLFEFTNCDLCTPTASVLNHIILTSLILSWNIDKITFIVAWGCCNISALIWMFPTIILLCNLTMMRSAS